MPLPQQKKLVKNGYEMYGFTPEEKFYVISGIRTAAYKDEEKNGDCFSIGKIREGRYVAMISDGMGTGNEANKESKKMIEVMEDMLGAESMAVKKYHFYAANCTDPNLKTICEKAEQMHRKHFDTMFQYLNSYASQSN